MAQARECRIQASRRRHQLQSGRSIASPTKRRLFSAQRRFSSPKVSSSSDSPRQTGPRLPSLTLPFSADNPVAAKLLTKTLERLSLQVHATTNGEEAVEEWEAHPADFFSLLLFDSRSFQLSRRVLVFRTSTDSLPSSPFRADMPLRDGPSAAARIRLLESKRGVVDRVAIVGLSADCQQSARLLSLSSGMQVRLSSLRRPISPRLSVVADEIAAPSLPQDYLSKPLRSGDLVKLLREYVLPRFKASLHENGNSSTASTL